MEVVPIAVEDGGETGFGVLREWSRVMDSMMRVVDWMLKVLVWILVTVVLMVLISAVWITLGVLVQ